MRSFFFSFFLALALGGLSLTGIAFALKIITPEADQSLVNEISANTIVSRSVESVQKQGKLLVMSTNITSKVSSSEDVWIFSRAVTSTTSARVEYTMDLSKFDKSWVQVKGKTLFVNLPKDYLKTELIQTGHTDVHNGSIALTKASFNQMKVRNKVILDKDLQDQANKTMDFVQPLAKDQLEHLFGIPLTLIGSGYSVNVSFW